MLNRKICLNNAYAVFFLSWYQYSLTFAPPGERCTLTKLMKFIVFSCGWLKIECFLVKTFPSTKDADLFREVARNGSPENPPRKLNAVDLQRHLYAGRCIISIYAAIINELDPNWSRKEIKCNWWPDQRIF